MTKEQKEAQESVETLDRIVHHPGPIPDELLLACQTPWRKWMEEQGYDV